MAKGPEEKRTMHPNSIANLAQNQPAPKERVDFGEAFKKDIYALWTSVSDGETGTTVGQDLLRKAAIDSPMSFLKMASGLLPKEGSASSVKPVLDFAETLRKLNKRVNAVDKTIKEEEVVINVLDEKPLPLEE